MAYRSFSINPLAIDLVKTIYEKSDLFLFTLPGDFFYCSSLSADWTKDVKQE
jgi:hypothetical protein